MSDHTPHPPPGAPPPGAEPSYGGVGTPGEQPRWGTPPPPPGWAPAPPPGHQARPGPGGTPPPGGAGTGPAPYPVPGMLGAAHKPGAVALRPLALGDIFDAAFRIIRFNPKATVGAAVIVSAVTMMVPVVLTAILTFTVGAALDSDAGIDPDAGTAELVGIAGSLVSLLGGVVLLQVGLVFVTGMIAHVTHAAAIGRKIGLGEAWAMTRGKRWRLLGLTALVNLALLLGLAVWVASVFVVGLATDSDVATIVYLLLSGLFLVLPLTVWFWVRVYYLPAPALMLEPIGVLAAIRRGYGLTRRQFWRVLGIALLTVLVSGVAGYTLSFPFSLVGQLITVAAPEYAVLSLVVTQALTSVISSAFTAPFTSAVTTLQYLDQRMRKEAYDVELMSRAGVLRQ